MKKLYVLSCILLLVLFMNSLYSQPRLVLHLTGGYSAPMADLKGDLLNTFEQNYGMKFGYNVGADAKFGFGSRRNFRVALSSRCTVPGIVRSASAMRLPSFRSKTASPAVRFAIS